MNYSSETILKFGKETGFINSNLEKVLRLLDVLSYISTELDPTHSMLVLKGGTAINLTYTNLARLSVDIDLDYVGSLDKNEASMDRINIINKIDNFMLNQGYKISLKSRESAILTSKTYSYENAAGNIDNIKLDINFIDRIHILPCVTKDIKYFGKEVTIKIPQEEELFAMKLCALIDRHKPRDLFDANLLMDHLELDKTLLRKLVVFYLSIDDIFEINEATLNNISFKFDSIIKELFPVMKKGEKFDLDKALIKVKTFLKDLLVLNDNEKMYLLEFSKGNFNPDLLFNGSEAVNASKHPMAKWRALVIKANSQS